MILYWLLNTASHWLIFQIVLGAAASPYLVEYNVLNEGAPLPDTNELFSTTTNQQKARLRSRNLPTTTRNFDNWQISHVDFQPNSGNSSTPGQFELIFSHGIGAVGSSVDLEIYSTDDSKTTLTDNCFSKGATLRGIVATAGHDQPIRGIDTDFYDPNVYPTESSGFSKTTSFIWTFNSDVNQNPDLYRKDASSDGFAIATVSFCVKFTLKDSTGIEVNYKEYALVFAYPG